MNENNHIIICVGRQVGSGGHDIARMLAMDFNAKYYDRELLNLAAKESGFNPELFKKADEKPGKGLGAAMIRTVASPFSALSNYYSNSVSNESLFQVQTDIILKKASTESCIIVGRCGDYILRNFPNLLRIFIRADYDDRVKFVCEHDSVTPAKARQIIDKTDNQRSEYHNFYSETNWGDSRAYDICVNSSLLGMEGTADFLLNFARKYFKIQ